MQTYLQWTSVILFMAVSTFLVAFGLLYANVNDLLWFHAAAVPPDAVEKVRPLYFALMKLIGASIGLGLLGAFVVLGPMRRGMPGAATMVSLTYWIAFGVAAFTAIRLNELTNAPVAWYNMAILSALTAAAYAAHTLAPRR
jgi:predicted anti-sigma-YlaC factor YlaD